jgi:Fe-S-cluster containining protein
VAHLTEGANCYTYDTRKKVDPLQGEIPEWSKGADCKSVGSAFEGSNPSLPIKPSAVGAKAFSSSPGHRRGLKGKGLAKASFYDKGLRFGCTRCSRCCRHTPGYVFLSRSDVERLCGFLNVVRNDFERLYCRHVPLGIATRISLTEKPNLDCVFWESEGCSVYEARPLQCRSFPFWSSSLAGKAQWEGIARDCPGIGGGPVHSRKEIEKWLRMRAEEGLLEA